MNLHSQKSNLSILILLVVLLISSKVNAENQNSILIGQAGNNPTLVLDINEPSVVQKSMEMFRNDVLEITGQVLKIKNSPENNGCSIIAGTLGQSKVLDKIVKKYNLNTDSVSGCWEAFSIQIINRKEGNLLVVLGSDRRGTAYGILELSRMIGISPWIWWADVKPVPRKELTLTLSKPVFQKPSVQYRGIFLNDEDWGLKPWSSKTLDPVTGEIGPKTYRKIFELLLRLRANTIWPAMHECTTPFYFVSGNAAMADSFGIVVSTSHCEPLMRSNPIEWDKKARGDYNIFTNKEKVIEYWSERLKEVSTFENVYTVGMRGIHDGAMEGAKTISKQVEGLTDVFGLQRRLLTNYLHKDAEQIPQIFIPYKEVLDAYDAGLKVPDDVTLVWCDDNYGYMKRLSNEAEQKRKGGSGVYYHISYWGRPHDYLWLATTQPSFIWEEMQKAWAYNARKMWILNVGDIKPAEYLIEFYLDMAWNINAMNSNQISTHLENWLGKTFGPENATPLKNIMNEYYWLAFIRRPEFMGWSQTEPTTKVKPTELNFTEFGDEMATRLQQYEKIENKVDSVYKKIPLSLRNAYFELIKYPVSGASQMNRKWLNQQYATVFSANQLPEVSSTGDKSIKAWQVIQKMTSYFNDSIENGKWKYIMSAQPRKLPVFDKPTLPEISPSTAETAVFWPEESEKPLLKGDTAHLVLDNCTKGIYSFGKDSFTIQSKPDWISIEQISKQQESTLPANKLILRLIPERMNVKTAAGLLILNSKGNKYYVILNGTFNPEVTPKDRCIILSASGFTRNNPKDFAHWQSIDGLGYSRSAMLLQPFNCKLEAEITNNPSLQFDFSIEKADSALIRLYLLPTHPGDSHNQFRIAVSIDNEIPGSYNFKTESRSNTWKENVLRNQAIVKIPWKFTSSGKHSLQVFAVDTDVAFDRLMIDFKTNRQFYGIAE
ncbi:MAG: glycosyl hydrolase 115 family protein [Paludibacter sp.]|nr:glycosyl hydrolase 115 family protein [Paludibacter sp.]